MAFLEICQFLHVGIPPSSELVTFRLSIFSKEDQMSPHLNLKEIAWTGKSSQETSIYIHCWVTKHGCVSPAHSDPTVLTTHCMALSFRLWFLLGWLSSEESGTFSERPSWNFGPAVPQLRRSTSHLTTKVISRLMQSTLPLWASIFPLEIWVGWTQWQSGFLLAQNSTILYVLIQLCVLIGAQHHDCNKTCS